MCAPSPIQHLVKIFSERCYAAVKADPTKEIGKIYNNILTEMTSNMSDEERIIFLDDIPDKSAIGPRLYTYRRNFIPREPDNFVSTAFKYFLSKSLIHIGFL